MTNYSKYPQWWKKERHLFSSTAKTCINKYSIKVASSVAPGGSRLSLLFNRENDSSIGLKSGEYAGRNSNLTPLYDTRLRNTIQRTSKYTPSCYEISDSWILMDSAIIHDNNRLCSRIWLHFT